MPEIGPEHPLSYRQEVLVPVFKTLRAYDSCAIVGSSSMGKSRLLSFMMRQDVRMHYLGTQVDDTLFLLVDLNRLTEMSEWGVYELILTALAEICGQHLQAIELRDTIIDLRRDAILHHDAVLTRRNAELVVHMLCQEQSLKLVFILDEMDEAYRVLPALALANLRALRDANKYQLAYCLLLREHPGRLRNISDIEGFYELFSRSVFGLGPYEPDDTHRILHQLEERKQYDLSRAERACIVQSSSGHPGLIVALFDIFARGSNDISEDFLQNALEYQSVREECEKLWGGLADDERLALHYIAQKREVSDDVQAVLALKKLIQWHDGYGYRLFNPVFTHFVQDCAQPLNETLLVDEAAGIAQVGSRQIDNLTANELRLLSFLYQRLGQVCEREDILEHLYPDDMRDGDVPQDNRIDTLIGRTRKKLEINPKQPRYLITVHGIGYKLVNGESSA